MKSWYSMRVAASGTSAEVMIYDEIGRWGVSAQAFIRDLHALGDVDELTVRLNSPGGDVFDGWAIYNALARHGAKKTVWVDGLAASMASVIALAGDEIVMPDNAMIMIHMPFQVVIGTADDMRAAAEALDKVTDGLVRAYVARSGMDENEIRQMMAAETWLSASEAVENGFATRVDDPVKMAAMFDLSKFKHAPAALVVDLDAEQVEPDQETEPEAETPEQDDPEVIDVDAISIHARTDALSYARQVAELCALAHRPERVGEFLAASTTVDNVRAALLDEAAAAQVEIDSRHAAARADESSKVLWGRVIGRMNGR